MKCNQNRKPYTDKHGTFRMRFCRNCDGACQATVHEQGSDLDDIPRMHKMRMEETGQTYKPRHG